MINVMRALIVGTLLSLSGLTAVAYAADEVDEDTGPREGPNYEFLIARTAQSRDINNDGSTETMHLIVRMSEKKRHFVFVVSVESGEKPKQAIRDAILWKDSYTMSFNSMSTFLETEGRMPLCEWASKFFSGNLMTGADFREKKLTENEIDRKFLREFAQEHGLKEENVAKMIFQQKTNYLLRYPTDWEYYVSLVYLPELKKFIKYNEWGD